MAEKHEGNILLTVELSVSKIKYPGGITPRISR